MAKKTDKLHFSKVERFSQPLVSFNEKLQGKYVRSGNDNEFPYY